MLVLIIYQVLVVLAGGGSINVFYLKDITTQWNGNVNGGFGDGNFRAGTGTITWTKILKEYL